MKTALGLYRKRLLQKLQSSETSTGTEAETQHHTSPCLQHLPSAAQDEGALTKDDCGPQKPHLVFFLTQAMNPSL